MKAHTIEFKNQLTELGRELRGVITYNNTELEEEIYSITPPSTSIRSLSDTSINPFMLCLLIKNLL